LAETVTEHNRWFHEEVHPHEAALRAYLRGAFPSVRDVDDVVQESFLRIWKARLIRPIASTKSFLFQVARHFVIDGVRRDQTAQTQSLGDLAALPVLEDRRNAVEMLTYKEKVSFLAEALASLPPRCREIMILRKFHKMPQAEIATRLAISERTVESQITRGMKLVAARLQARGLDGFDSDER
jgi:RNA polymerase sigma-70 factor (ECF subfamily)